MLGLILLIYGFIEYKRKNYYNFYIVFFLFITNGYQIIPDVILLMPALGITKSYDYASFLILGIILTEFSALWVFVKKYWIFISPIGLLLIVCGLDFFFSKIVFGYSWNSVIRTFRNYLLLFSPFLFMRVPLPIDKKLLKFIVIVTVLQSILYILQIVLHAPLIKSAVAGEATGRVLENGYSRFYNLPNFVIPSLIIVAYCAVMSTKFQRNLVMGILATVLLSSLHRNLILVVFPVMFMYKLVFNPSRNIALFALIPIAFLILMATPVIGDRINEGFDQASGTADISNIHAAINNYDNSETNTSTFRYLHFAERFLFVINQPQYIPFGLGMLTEDSPEAQKLDFKIGTVSTDSQTYKPKQIDTGDIAWSAIIITTGFTGLVAMVYFIVFYIRLLYKNRFFAVAKVMLIWLTILLFISFFGTEIISIPFRAFFSFLLCLFIKCYYFKPESTASSILTPVTANK